jgi:hypothetical protein
VIVLAATTISSAVRHVSSYITMTMLFMIADRNRKLDYTSWCWRSCRVSFLLSLTMNIHDHIDMHVHIHGLILYSWLYYCLNVFTVMINSQTILDRLPTSNHWTTANAKINGNRASFQLLFNSTVNHAHLR